MPIFQVDLEEHAPYGKDWKSSLLFDSDREILVRNFGVAPYGITDTNGRYAGTINPTHVTDYRPEIDKIKRVLQDPTDPQKHPSGFYIKSATVRESDMARSDFDKLVESLQVARHVENDPRVKRLLAEGWIFHANYDPREQGGLESAMHTSASPFVRPSNAGEVLIIDTAYGLDGKPLPGDRAIYIRDLKQPK